MSVKRRFEIELTRFTPAPLCARENFSTQRELFDWLVLPLKDDAVLSVTIVDEQTDYGNFYIFLNPHGLAWVQLYEHREYTPVEPQRVDDKSRILFMDESAQPFEVSGAQILTREQALEALQFWLPDQKRLPSLNWL